MFDWVYQILPHAGVVLGFVLGMLLVSRLLRQRRSTTGTLAWLLVMVFIPYVGIPLYFILGGRKLRRRTREKSQLDIPRSEEVYFADPVHSADRLLRKLGLPPATKGNRLVLLQHSQETYERVIRALRDATDSIFLETYIFRLDDIGREVLDLLIEKAHAGVEVRLLVDAFGAKGLREKHMQELRDAGGHAAFFMPLYRVFRRRMDLRNHRKLLIVDGKTVFAGGTNIGSEYMNPQPYDKSWADLTFVLEGPAVLPYLSVFQMDWTFAAGGEMEIPFEACQVEDGQAVLQVVPSGPDAPDDPLYNAILTSIYEARQRVWIVSPYFIPDESLIQALELACRRDVDVRVLVPAETDHMLIRFARGPYLRRVQQAGGAVHLYQPGMMHAKIFLMDEEIGMIGSANFDVRSQFLDYEITTFVYSTPELRAVEDWVNRLWPDTTVGLKEVGVVRETIEGVFGLLSPLL
jgi:cardiolipin synthase